MDITNNAQAAAMDRAGELPLERRVAERRAEPPALVTMMAATVAALQERLASARGDALEDAARLVEGHGRSGEWTDRLYLWQVPAAIRALASQPAAPAHTMFDTFDNILKIQRREAESGDPYMVGLYNGMAMMCSNVDGVSWDVMTPAAPPVQQPGDVRGVDYIMEAVQCFASEWSLVGGRFDRGGMLEQAEGTKARIRRMLETPALATTRPSAALTEDEQIALLCKVEDYMAAVDWAGSQLHEKCIKAEAEICATVSSLIEARLAASGGALAVPEGDK